MRRKSFSVLVLIAVAALGLFAAKIHGFLAISRPVAADILVVEGWIWRTTALDEAAALAQRERYKWVVTVGGLSDERGEDGGRRSLADLAAGRLRALGVDGDRIVPLATSPSEQHRTFQTAIVFKDWMARVAPEATAVNVFTRGPHARKSRVLFRRVLDPRIQVGVIAGVEDSYAPRRWWMSRRGIHVVSRKLLGYLYACVWPLPMERSSPAADVRQGMLPSRHIQRVMTEKKSEWTTLRA